MLKVIEKIAPRIIIEASPDNFVFESRRSRVQIEPFVYIRVDNESLIVAVGKDFPNDPDITRIDLFANCQYPEQVSDRAVLLEAFLRFGIQQVTGHSIPHFIMRYIVLRPIIVFRGLEKFVPLFCGYERYIFNSLLKEQMVLTVLFE
jgi:hypothetical protein